MSSYENLLWKARMDRRLIEAGGGRRHLVVDVKAPRNVDRPVDRQPLNLGLVIDASGSMTGAPLEAAKSAARGVLGSLGPQDRLTLVSFAAEVIVHTDAIVVDDRGRAEAQHAIDRLVTRGCTDLAAGWLTGCRCVAAAMEDANSSEVEAGPRQSRVIVLSDGHANRGIIDPDELGRHASELRGRGLYSSTVGIGDGYSPVQLDAIAEHGGGRTHDAPLGEDIVAVVLGELGEILETAAEDMTLLVVPPRGMGVEVFGRYPVTHHGDQVRIALGGLVRGASRQIVIQLTVPTGQVGDHHEVKVLADWREPASIGREKAPSMRAVVSVASAAEVAAELPDLELGRAVAHTWQGHLELNSTLLNSEGRCDEAGRMVRGAQASFSNYCQDIPDTDELMISALRHCEDVSRPMSAASCLMKVCSSKMSLKSEKDFRINKRSRR